jgi:glycosyltransferase involved in cell wall biosynthesis
MKFVPNVLIVATHPIQYQVPWFQALAKRSDINLEVLFLSILNSQEQGVGFGIDFQWDIPLLEGYKWSEAKEFIFKTGRKGFFAQSISRSKVLIQKLKPDIVILTGWQVLPLLQILFVCKFLKIPCIVRGESNSLKPRPLWVRLIHRQLISHYDAFLVIGKANHDFYVENGASKNRLFNCPYFIDNQRFILSSAALSIQRDLLRKKWQITPSATCFCYVGKLEPKKRIFDLLEALRLLKTQSHDLLVHLLVVGTGQLMTEAQSFVSEYNLPVTFAGFLNQSEISQAYVAADCLVLASDYGETWGLVVNEAMACGLPAIVSDRVGCGKDLVKTGKTGEIVPFGNTVALSESLQKFSLEPSNLQQMGENARQLVSDQYAIANTVTGTIAAINSLLTKNF